METEECKCEDVKHISGKKFICNKCGKKWNYCPWLMGSIFSPWEEDSQENNKTNNGK